MLKNKLKILEIYIPTHYGNEVSHLKSVPYGLSVLFTTIKSQFFVISFFLALLIQLFVSAANPTINFGFIDEFKDIFFRISGFFLI